jgi:3-oxoacyl-[acyl-carrier protein] reductase
VLLEGKRAVVYGAGGPVGGAVARAFAREGARVFLAGRTLATLEPVADDIAASGGSAEAASVDALDAESVDAHAASMVDAVGGIDISFNAIGHGDVHGQGLLEMPYEDFVRPITVAMRAQFLTSRAAARSMVRQGSGVIMAITASTARMAIPNVGGTGVAFDAIESQCRQWAAELGPRGVRVVWLRTTGIQEAISASIPRFPDYGTGHEGGMTRAELVAWLEEKTLLRRLTSLREVGDAAAFVASNMASAMTACAINLSLGSVRDG